MNKTSSQWSCFQKANQFFCQSDFLLYPCLTAVKCICLLVQHCSHPICIPQLLQSAMPPHLLSARWRNEGWRYPLYPLSLLWFKRVGKWKHQKNSPNILFWRKWRPLENNLFKGLSPSKYCIFIDTSFFVMDFNKRDVKSLKFLLK